MYMPLIRVDIIEGRSPEDIKALLDATHRTLVSVFKIPQRDRYQIVHEHPPSHFVVEDTGLGITRTRKCVVIQVTTRPRGGEAKESFYNLLCRELELTCGIPPSDVVVSMVTNFDEDWSFGNGRAQFLTGELTPSTEGGLTTPQDWHSVSPQHRSF
jgi:phenylpyruvate tautomerase PptA (4-oxalocrotonate tautomerase family)